MFTTKVTAHRASQTRTYPSIRLPKEYGTIIGKKAEIIPTSHEGKQAFLVVVDQECVHSVSTSPLEARVEELEKQLALLQKTASKE